MEAARAPWHTAVKLQFIRTVHISEIRPLISCILNGKWWYHSPPPAPGRAGRRGLAEATAGLTRALSGNPSQSQHYHPTASSRGTSTPSLIATRCIPTKWEGGRNNLKQLPSLCSRAAHQSNIAGVPKPKPVIAGVPMLACGSLRGWRVLRELKNKKGRFNADDVDLDAKKGVVL
eukprot:1194479-Prorocentrum_minimum.AAC.1